MDPKPRICDSSWCESSSLVSVRATARSGGTTRSALCTNPRCASRRHDCGAREGKGREGEGREGKGRDGEGREGMVGEGRGGGREGGGKGGGGYIK
jgi:hypothetical protein